MKTIRLFLAVAAMLIPFSVMAQPDAYRLFDSKGKPVTYKKMVDDLAAQDVVFFGEMHNDPICHWMELQLIRSLYSIWGNDTSLGMEMFEADNQIIIDEYWQGVITQKNFEDEVRLWPNYSTDYAPAVDYAFENGIPLVATNVPRRYASVVRNHGLQYLDSLSAEAKAWLPQLPIPYVSNAQAEEAFQMMAALGQSGTNSAYMGQSQGLKDATMAWFVSKRQRSHMLHINGNYHTQASEGILRYLRHYAPGTKVKVIYSAKQEDTASLDSTYMGLADYYLVVPEDMVTSY